MIRIYKRMVLIVKVCWFVACVMFLLNLFFYSNDFSNKEAIITFVLSMKAVTFPIGHLIWALFSFKSMVLPGAIISIQFELFIRWVGFVAAGYFQWFYVLPIFYSLVKKRFIK